MENNMKAIRMPSFDMEGECPYGVCFDIYTQDGEYLEQGENWMYFETEQVAEDFCEAFNKENFKTI